MSPVPRTKHNAIAFPEQITDRRHPVDAALLSLNQIGEIRIRHPSDRKYGAQEQDIVKQCFKSQRNYGGQEDASQP
jgi:hypothetical protein